MAKCRPKRLVGHANTDSTAIILCEKVCRKNTPKKKLEEKKKRERKSKAELENMKAQQTVEIRTRLLALQENRSLEENLADLSTSCEWGGKRNSKGGRSIGRRSITFGDGGVPLAAILISASVQNSKVAIPLMQMAVVRGITGNL